MTKCTLATPSTWKRRFARETWAAGLFCLTVATAAPVAAVTGYSVYTGGDLAAVDLETGTFEIIGPTVPAIELAADPAGQLYAVAGLPTSRLYRIDRTNAAATLVGDVGDDLGVVDLTFDDAGTLWMVADGGLYTVDPGSGTPTLIGTPDSPLLALAAHGGVLYGVVRLRPDFESQLVRIDPATVAVTLIAELPDIPPAGLYATFSMAFDGAGTLWLYVVWVPPILPPDFPQEFYRIADPEAPVPEHTFSLSTPPGFSGLAVPPGVLAPAVEVPAIGRFGAIVLATLLLAGGLFTLRRRVEVRNV